MLVAGNCQAQAVVRVVAVDDDGQVHFTVLPGSVDKSSSLSVRQSETLDYGKRRRDRAPRGRRVGKCLMSGCQLDAGQDAGRLDQGILYALPAARATLRDMTQDPVALR